MQCDYCGDEFTERPYYQDGQTFCSVSCADKAAIEEEFGGDYDDKDDTVLDEDYELDNQLDESL